MLYAEHRESDASSRPSMVSADCILLGTHTHTKSRPFRSPGLPDSPRAYAYYTIYTHTQDTYTHLYTHIFILHNFTYIHSHTYTHIHTHSHTHTPKVRHSDGRDLSRSRILCTYDYYTILYNLGKRCSARRRPSFEFSLS